MQGRQGDFQVSVLCFSGLFILTFSSIVRKLVKRIEDLLRDSTALKANILPQLNSLTILISKGVDFAIQVSPVGKVLS